jgi:hypothetical protein
VKHFDGIVIFAVIHDFKQVPRTVETSDEVFIVKTRHKNIGDIGFERMPYVRFFYSVIKRRWNKNNLRFHSSTLPYKEVFMQAFTPVTLETQETQFKRKAAGWGGEVL